MKEESVKPLSINNAFKVELKLDNVPEKIRRIVSEISQVHSVPESCVLPVVLTVISTAIGKGAYIAGVLGHPETPLNMMSLIIMPSGSGKGTIFRAVLDALSEVQSELRKEFHEEIKPKLIHELQELQRDKKPSIEQIRRIEKIKESLEQPTLYVGASTGEGIGKKARRNGGQIATISPEAGECFYGVLGSNRKLGQDVDYVLSGFSGEPYGRNTAGSGEDQSVPNLLLSIAWAIQPCLFRDALKNQQLLSRGFFARFITAIHEGDLSLDNGEEIKISEITLNEWKQLVRILYSFRNETEPVEVSASKEAKDLLREYSNSRRIICNQLSESDPMRQTYLRSAEKASRIAGLFCIVENPTKENPEINSEMVNVAIDIINYYDEQMEYEFSRLDQQEMNRIISVLKSSGGQISTAEMRKRNGKIVDKAIDLINRNSLAPFELVSLKPDGVVGGRPSEVLRLKQIELQEAA